MLLDGRPPPTGIRRKGLDRTLLLMINAHWRREVALANSTDEPFRTKRQASYAGTRINLSGRSMMLWELQTRMPYPTKMTPFRIARYAGQAA
jgi:hypothetical protein